MSGLKVEISWESASEISKEYLKDTLNNIKDDLKKREEGKGIAIFSLDKDEDIAELKSVIASFEVVLGYCGEY